VNGVGPFVANMACGELAEAYATTTMVDGKEVAGLNYRNIFQYSLYTALTGAALLLLFFHPPKKGDEVPV
jgi:hypothetical protein